jgi:hypothetical protein
MEKKLKENGWTLFSSCNCGGTMARKFKSNRFLNTVIELRPNAKSWLVQKSNRTILSGKEKDFETKMMEAGYVKGDIAVSGDAATQ